MDGAGSDRFELLAQLTARLASTARLDEIVNTVIDEIVELGFGDRNQIRARSCTLHRHSSRRMNAALQCRIGLFDVA